jgi:hypothetical protein
VSFDLDAENPVLIRRLLKYLRVSLRILLAHLLHGVSRHAEYLLGLVIEARQPRTAGLILEDDREEVAIIRRVRHLIAPLAVEHLAIGGLHLLVVT